MPYKYIVRSTAEQLFDAEKALGWTSVRIVDLPELATAVRINGALTTDADIGDAVEKAAAIYAVANPLKTSALKA